ncbi:MAG: cytochrome c1 [Rhodospirillales bacterium]|nr:cytochrome c1 [Rhodospirillales bacterium]
MRKFVISAVFGAVLAASAVVGSAFAAGDAVKVEGQDWSFSGVFGKYDKKQLQRGFLVYKDVCAGCHGLRQVAYRNLLEIGLTEEAVKEYAAEFEVPAGPNDDGETIVDGELLVRPAKLSDKMVPPFANEQAARVSNSGAFPPDLSLMTKARMNGPDYLYALLTKYEEEVPEAFLKEYKEKHGEEFVLPEGMSFNHVFPGYQIAMAQPLSEESVEYEDGTEPTLENHAKDVTAFLNWAAEPELEARKSMGVKVMIFLLLLSVMLFALKKRIWSDVH